MPVALIPQWPALFPTVTTLANIVTLWYMCQTQRKPAVFHLLDKSDNIGSAHFDTSLPTPVRKYLQTYGLTPPRVESYEVQDKRCQSLRWGKEDLAYLTMDRPSTTCPQKDRHRQVLVPELFKEEQCPSVLSLAGGSFHGKQIN